GAAVFNADGSLRWTGAAGWGNNLDSPMSIVVDLDGDSVPEILAGNTAYRADGSIYWHRSDLTDGFTAVGDFLQNGLPQVVLVSAGRVYLLGHDGQTLWGEVQLPGGGRGGAPTVGDFNSDGQAEIGVAGARYYTVLDGDGTILWQAPTRDLSSNVSAGTLVDFTGEGLASVVYRDETALHVWRGRDGT